MSETEQPMNNPPRSVTVPAFPPPQTVEAFLDHTPLPISDSFNISDLPPDFEWMTSMHAYVGTFEYSKTNKPSETLAQFSVNAPYINYKPGNAEFGIPHGADMVWQNLPFMCSKWWSGGVAYKFLAIKPPRVTGKLIVRYSFHNDYQATKQNLGSDSLYRGIKKEWDLGLSNEFEFDVTAFCPLPARPTWLQENQQAAKGAGVNITYTISAAQAINPSTYMMGKIYVQPAQYLQPGSIFPDSIRILVFRYFKMPVFRQLSDPSHYQRHSLYTDSITAPLYWNPWDQPGESFNGDRTIDKYYKNLSTLALEMNKTSVKSK